MIKKQRILIIIAVAVFAVLLAVYFIFNEQLFPARDDASETSAPPPETLEGEAIGEGNSLMMYPGFTRNDIEKIEIDNPNGSFSFRRDLENQNETTFVLDGYEHAPFIQETLSMLVVTVSRPIVMERIASGVSDLTEYGLSEADGVGKITVTKTDGTSHTIEVGDKVVTGAGYYAKLAGGNTVYAIEASSGGFIKEKTKEDLITPMLVLPASQSDYHLVDDFMIAKRGSDGQMYKFIQAKADSKKTTDSAGNETVDFLGYTMIFPSGYDINTTNFDSLLMNFLAFEGDRVAYLGKYDEIIDDETLEKYGLLDRAFDINIDYKGVQNTLMISGPKNGKCYVYTFLYNTIVEASTSYFDFLDWDFREFVESNLMIRSINDVGSVQVKTPDFDETFILSLDPSSDTKKDKGIKIKTLSGKDIDTENFRKLFREMISVSIIGYSELEDVKDLDCAGTVTFITRTGEKRVYSFYPYASRRCAYTVNGGEPIFYVKRATVDTVLDDAKKVFNGETINYFD